MAELAISEFYEGMRAALGDEGVTGSYDWSDERLAAGIRTIIRAGFVSCVGIKTGDTAKLDPAPPNPDTWGYIMLKACFLLRGGETPRSINTRAMSVNVQPIARRDSLMALEVLLSNLEERGNICGSPTATGENGGLFVAVHDFLSEVHTLCDYHCPTDSDNPCACIYP